MPDVTVKKSTKVAVNGSPMQFVRGTAYSFGEDGSFQGDKGVGERLARAAAFGDDEEGLNRIRRVGEGSEARVKVEGDGKGSGDSIPDKGLSTVQAAGGGTSPTATGTTTANGTVTTASELAPPAEPDFDGMTLSDLQRYADANEIDLGDFTRKADVLGAVKDGYAKAKAVETPAA